jgi:hypothetical protein
MAEKLELAVIVNGQPTMVAASPNAPLHTIIEPALHQTGNSGQPASAWELRDANGVILDADRKIKEFPPGERFFLNLRAGVGGC